MDDLKSVTLAYLRDLARTHLGPGHSKLTKKELIAALAEFVPALKKLARLAGIELPTRAKPTAKAVPSAAKSSREPRGKEARVTEKKDPERKKEPAKPEKKAAAKAAAKGEDVSQSLKPAQVVNFPPRERAARSAEEEWAQGAEVVESVELEIVSQHAAEPLMEGFFVARLMGERELRRHHLTEEQASRVVATPTGFEENLGELPLDYENDLALALARDPHTLFITWDFSAAILARARDGLESPRPMLRVFDGDRLVREVEFVPESRSFYIHGLPPGRPYRVEAHYVGREGRSRRIGHSTHPLTLPRTGPSTDTAVRFMQMPPPPKVEPLTGAAPAVEPPAPSREEVVEEREYISWRRVPLPGSDEMGTLAERRRERTTRPVRESAGPPERLEHLEISARPFGSSEQSAAGGAARGGASEQTHWTPPQSGRGR
ncbi:MAG: DUF4912 domain-containing protein [Hyalangium sp.]|uniref:DUF4912 domain-containing protein n=1 Tax=Hyalangium sp. TaxID=2028555 RepID=UPI00389ADCF6